MDLLGEHPRKFVLQLLSEFPEMEQDLFLGKFGAQIGAEGRPVPLLVRNFAPKVSYDVMILKKSEHDLFVATTEGDGYCTYDIHLDDYPEKEGWPYYREHAHGGDVIKFLHALFSEQYVCFRAIDGDESGIIDISKYGAHHNSWPIAWAWPWQQKPVMRYSLKSWHGNYNREIQTLGHLRGY